MGRRNDSQLRVILVDDDEQICNLIRAGMEQAGILVETVHTLANATVLIDLVKPALILLDVTLPDGCGMHFCSRLRANGYSGIIMMLTARGAARDRIDGLEGGADDYLAKPFEFRELMARTVNWLRHADGVKKPVARRPRFACFGSWRMDLLRPRILAPDGSVVMLSTSEYDLLKRLSDTPHVEVSREDLVPERKKTVHLDRSLDNRICRLRNKLASHVDNESLIVTVRNRGFMLSADVTYEVAC